MPPRSAPPDDTSTINGAARSSEPDRVIAASLALRNARQDLLTVAAFLGEIRRIPLSVSDATLGEIRLQWWRDTLEAGAQGGFTGNPIADEMVRVKARRDLPLSLVLAPLEAASVELSGEPVADAAAWRAYLDDAEGAGFQLSARCLDVDEQQFSLPFFRSAARAYGAIRLALRLPELVSRQRWPVPPFLDLSGDPREGDEATARAVVRQAGEALSTEAIAYLRVARERSDRASPHTLAAILPAALVPLYAKAIERTARDALREPAEISPIARVSRLWWASRTGRI